MVSISLRNVSLDYPLYGAYDYSLNTANPLAKQVMYVRSWGRDKVASSASYSVNSFDPTDYDQDIVWADGFFVRWPQKGT